MCRAMAKDLFRLDTSARAEYWNVNDKSVPSYFRDKGNTEAIRYCQMSRRYNESKIRLTAELSQDEGIPCDVGVGRFGRTDVGEDQIPLHPGVLHDDLKRFTTDFLEYDDKRTWFFATKSLKMT
jgi:hypothetical protein